MEVASYDRRVSDVPSIRLDKTAFSVTPLGDRSDDRVFWRSRSTAERLEAIELMRQVNYGYDPITARLQRVLTVAERERG
jgi:hypothetical protein